MKRLTLLLVLFLTLGLTATFALDVEPSWAGSATLTWGLDLDTMETGFLNEDTGSVTLTFVDEETVEASGDGTVYGYIKLADASVSISDAGAAGTAPTVTAMIYLGPAWIQIAQAPDMAFDYAADVEGATDGVANSDYAGGGFTFGVPVGPATVKAYVVSMDDWTGTQDNNYAVGATTNVGFGPVTLDVYAVTGLDWLATDYIGLGASANVDTMLGSIGLVIDVDADAQIAGGGLDFEVAAGTDLVFAYDADDAMATYVGMDVSYSDDATLGDLDFGATFAHSADYGWVPGLAASVSATVYDIIAAMSMAVDVTGSYAIDDIVPGFGVGYDLGDVSATGDEVFDLNVYLTLGGLVPLTVFTLDYTSTQLLTGMATAQDLGVFTFKTVITYE